MVVASTGAVPADVIAVSTRIAPESRNLLGAALLDLNPVERDLVNLIFHCDGFERCLPVHVKALERLRQNTEADR
jgi:ABC-type phosphate/phosphonate transport system substrate-binding protein